MKKHSIYFGALMILTQIILGLGIIEGMARLVGYKPWEDGDQSSVTGYFWISDKILGFKNRPNGSYCDNGLISKPVSTTDQFGYRNGFGWSYDSNSLIVLFIGDSTTLCSEVNDDDTGPSEVAKLIGRDFNIRVLNAGVRGYGTLQSMRMLELCLKRFSEIKIVIYTYCWNDFIENLNSDIYFPAQTPIALWHKGKLKPIEITNPRIPYGTSLDSYARKHPDNKILKTIKHYLASYTLMFLLKEGIKNYYDLYEAKHNHGDEILTELISQMNRMCHSRGIIFLSTEFFNGTPGKGPDFQAICKKAGVNYFDIKKYFIEKPEFYMAQRRSGTYDPHYGPEGTKTFAKAVASQLKDSLIDAYLAHNPRLSEPVSKK